MRLFLSTSCPISLKISLSIILSLIIIAIMSLTLYSLKINLGFLKTYFTIIIVGLWLLNIRMNKSDSNISLVTKKFIIDKWFILLILIIGTAVSVSFTIAATHRFMVPGDAWYSLAPGYFAQNLLDIKTYFGGAEYPVIWGFLVGGISSVIGIPIINTNVMMFPVSAITILSFYVLARVFFALDKGKTMTSIIFFGFCGGLGWLANLFLHEGFWSISDKTLDMYFSTMVWNNFAFTHKGLALSSCFIVITLLILALNRQKKSEQIFLSC